MTSLLDDDSSLRLVQLARVERFGEVGFDFSVGGDGEGLVFVLILRRRREDTDALLLDSFVLTQRALDLFAGGT